MEEQKSFIINIKELRYLNTLIRGAVNITKIFGFSEASYIALHCMGLIAANGGERISIKEMASLLGVSEAHLAKVILRLSRTGLLNTTRGPGGGAVLAREPGDITFLDIVESIEGPLSDSGCVFGREKCVYKSCMFRGFLSTMTEETRKWLSENTLSDFVLCTGKGK